MKTPRIAGSCYDYINDFWTTINNEFPDITAAFYNGDFSKSLEQAQKDKHDWVLEGICFEKDDRVLDIGCGWGPILNAIREREGLGIGFTISKKQVEYCRKKRLETYLQDWKNANYKYGKFDGIVSIGAFEHFCSVEEYKESKQKEIYDQFFRYCYDSLQNDGKLFLQTMTWGYKVPELSEINMSSKKYHDRVRALILGMSSWWPPSSEEQIIEIAEPYFTFLESSNGREDYAQTFFEWHKKWEETNFLRKLMIYVATYSKYIGDPDFLRIMRNFEKTRKNEYFREAFLQKVLSHSRIFFVKK